MSSRWSLAFATATVVALVGTEVLRRVALAAGFVDLPGPTKAHSRPTPYLGGAAIAGAAFAGWLFAPRLPTRLAAAAVAAAFLAVVGLLDDHRILGHRSRLAAQVVAAAAVIGAGVRAQPSGVEALDVAVTFLWIVGITNALNLLDNMDGLAAGVAAVAAGGLFVLLAGADQPVVGVCAAALAGACCGFLAHNTRPASIFMGDAGSLFLGFVLAVAAIEVRPGLSPPGSLVVPLVLLALPVLDTTVVTLARLRHGRRIMVGGTDHLSHRLVTLGLSPGAAVGTLVGVQALLTAVAVLVGRQVLAPLPGLALAVSVLAAIGALGARVDVYQEPAVRLRVPAPLRIRE
ncbi:MAG: undecaprenyl/decaprenyl-phosphate alpha-N-acetylglucosaminyl 1-phosphate transferase [Acidimicrobiia bacterium]